MRFVAALLVLGWLAAGCVSFREFEASVHREPGRELARVRLRYLPIGSDEQADSALRDDFRGLVASVTEDEGLLMWMDGHLYVTRRTLELERGEVAATVTGLCYDTSFVLVAEQALGNLEFRRAERDSAFELRSSDSLVSTNGQVVARGEEVRVRWPRDAVDLRFRLLSRVTSHLTSLAPYYREWRAKQAIPRTRRARAASPSHTP